MPLMVVNFASIGTSAQKENFLKENPVATITQCPIARQFVIVLVPSLVLLLPLAHQFVLPVPQSVLDTIKFNGNMKFNRNNDIQ